MATQVDGFHCRIADLVVDHVINHLKKTGRLPQTFKSIAVDGRSDPVFASRQTQRMFGRSVQLEIVLKAVREGQHVAIIGGPGNGKTTLAHETALQLWAQGVCPAGVFVVDVAGAEHCLANAVAGCCCIAAP